MGMGGGGELVAVVDDTSSSDGIISTGFKLINSSSHRQIIVPVYRPAIARRFLIWEIIEIESIKTTSMEDVSTRALEKNEEYLRR